MRSIVTTLIATVVFVAAAAAAPAPALAGPGDYSVSDSAVVFGDVEVGDHRDIALVVTNTSVTDQSPDLSGSGVSPGSGAWSMFATGTGGCNGATLSPGESCTVHFRFAPTVAGPDSTTAGLWLDGGFVGNIDLSGTGVEAYPFTVAPTDLDFGAITVGDTETAVVNITNTSASEQPLTTAGGAPLDGTDFSSFQNCAGLSTLPAGGSCQLTYEFTPTVPGPLSDASSYTVSGTSWPITLAGEGVAAAPAWTVAPTELDFGSVPMGASSSLDVTLTNTGPAAAMPDLAGTGTTAPFTLGEGTCLAVVDPGSSCTGAVLFTPESEGPAAEDLTVVVDGNPVGTVALTGTGVVPSDTSTTSTPDDGADSADSTTSPTTDTAEPASELPRTGNRELGLLIAAAGLCFIAAAVALAVSTRTLRRPLRMRR